jgi:HK97 gp10 family phage protein
VKITVKIEGLSRCQAAFRDLPDAVGKKVVRNILIERAEPIAETVRSLAPIDQGDLRESVAVSTRLTRAQRAIYRKEGPDDVDVFIGPGNNPQAHMQEFGTQHHPPQPYLRPAWDRHIDKVFERIAEDLWAAIRKALARHARKGP